MVKNTNKNYGNEKQFARSAENLAIFKENDKRIWRCMNKMTRILQDLDVLGALCKEMSGGPWNNLSILAPLKKE